MRKFSVLMLIAMVMILCVGCGPYGKYSGTYTRSLDSATITVTLSSSGSFKYERKSKQTNQYDPYNKIVREGTFTVEDGKIYIKYSYYEDALGKTVNGTATASLNGNKLVITDSDSMGISGTFIKK